MSTKMRKARKRAGEKFEKPAKEGTPLFQRFGFYTASSRKQERMMAARGIEIRYQTAQNNETKENTTDER